MSDETKLVVVGYGMGSWHAKLIHAVDGLALHGVCDLDAAKREKAVGEYPGIILYEGYEQVLADSGVDGVVIVTPHNVHAEMAIAAMDAGKHTVTDKAMCLMTDEARAMIAARDRNGVLLSVFHNRRWDNDFVTVRKILDEKMLGRLYHIQSCVTHWGQLGGWRRDRAAMGGWLFDWGAHTIDQLLLIEPSKPMHVYAFEHYRYDDPASVEDYVNCTITFESGLTATTVISYIHRLQMPRWQIMGQRGALIAEDFSKPVQIKTEVNGLEIDISVPLIKSDWKCFYQNIADTLAGREELNVKPEQLVPQIAVAQAAYRSIATKQVVEVERV